MSKEGLSGRSSECQISGVEAQIDEKSPSLESQTIGRPRLQLQGLEQNAQAGVQTVEAITLSWSKTWLITAFLW